jgi:beta-glucanase (GH16 family)
VTTNYEAVGDGPPNLVELDANEIFGGGSIVRQTIHYGYNPSIPGEQQQTSKLMVPDPSTSYHTYGILWTPTTSQFFIDRVANSPAYHTVSTGPMYSMIDLAVFAKGTWAPPPTVTTPQTMNLQYFRWYQTTGQSCSPSNVSS